MAGSRTYGDDEISWILDQAFVFRKKPSWIQHEFLRRFGRSLDPNQLRYVKSKYGKDPKYKFYTDDDQDVNTNTTATAIPPRTTTTNTGPTANKTANDVFDFNKFPTAGSYSTSHFDAGFGTDTSTKKSQLASDLNSINSSSSQFNTILNNNTGHFNLGFNPLAFHAPSHTSRSAQVGQQRGGYGFNPSFITPPWKRFSPAPAMANYGLMALNNNYNNNSRINNNNNNNNNNFNNNFNNSSRNNSSSSSNLGNNPFHTPQRPGSRPNSHAQQPFLPPIQNQSFPNFPTSSISTSNQPFAPVATCPSTSGLLPMDVDRSAEALEADRFMHTSLDLDTDLFADMSMDADTMAAFEASLGGFFADGSESVPPATRSEALLPTATGGAMMAPRMDGEAAMAVSGHGPSHAQDFGRAVDVAATDNQAPDDFNFDDWLTMPTSPGAEQDIPAVDAERASPGADVEKTVPTVGVRTKTSSSAADEVDARTPYFDEGEQDALFGGDVGAIFRIGSDVEEANLFGAVHEDPPLSVDDDDIRDSSVPRDVESNNSASAAVEAFISTAADTSAPQTPTAKEASVRGRSVDGSDDVIDAAADNDIIYTADADELDESDRRVYDVLRLAVEAATPEAATSFLDDESSSFVNQWADFAP